MVISSQQEVKPCFTCGSAECIEVICSCLQCGERCHVWCMRINLHEVPDSWVCDGCQARMEPERSPKHTSKRMKDLKASKVKYLPEPEAANLLSKQTANGALPVQEVYRNRYQTSTAASKNGSPAKPSAPVRDFNQLAKNLKEQRELQKSGKKNADSMRPNSENRELRTPEKKNADVERPNLEKIELNILGKKNADVARWPTDHRHVSFKISGDHLREGKGCGRKPIPITKGDGLSEALASESKTKMKVQTNEKPFFEIFTKNPVRDNAIWSGRFEILNHPDHGVCDGLQAYAPSRIHRKAYFFSKNTLPSALEFKLIPRCDLWEEMFQDDPPDEDEVALYIIPENHSRTSEKYKHLVETLDSTDCAMHTIIDGMELIVFTSRGLALACKGELHHLSLGLSVVNSHGFMFILYFSCYNKFGQKFKSFKSPFMDFL